MQSEIPSSELIVPSGKLEYLTLDQIKASANNPRHLFDPEPLATLKKSIATHGVLVPLTVYRDRGQRRYSILDGERRYRCCVLLAEEGLEIKLPANIVAPPDPLAGVLYMFSIHNFREQWELMPTALSLKLVMEKLNETDSSTLQKLTGLSDPQIERCKILLTYDEEFQNLSLDPDPKLRIPSNFWIEAYPVIKICLNDIPELSKKGKTWIIWQLVNKYRAKVIKSVIHFRMIKEAFEVANTQRDIALQCLKTFVNDEQADIKSLFTSLVDEPRRVKSALEASKDFLQTIRKSRVDLVASETERRALIKALKEVQTLTNGLLVKLSGEDDPSIDQ